MCGARHMRRGCRHPTRGPDGRMRPAIRSTHRNPVREPRDDLRIQWKARRTGPPCAVSVYARIPTAPPATNLFLLVNRTVMCGGLTRTSPRRVDTPCAGIPRSRRANAGGRVPIFPDTAGQDRHPQRTRQPPHETADSVGAAQPHARKNRHAGIHQEWRTLRIAMDRERCALGNVSRSRVNRTFGSWIDAAVKCPAVASRTNPACNTLQRSPMVDRVSHRYVAALRGRSVPFNAGSTHHRVEGNQSQRGVGVGTSDGQRFRRSNESRAELQRTD